ncbi:type I restriction enzyme, S subunit [Malonomonas rubra DSM 5091]|uniref:Type I restriction enzyme, S subunit n=1 Tax=Malonomonas rubra DSM 5091 TaxID=1122189 RepID=A0A1M6L616_MALRU|nr:restriction endonuclease subunit S [Malonomonas rubra]SHJ66645.1 type I restriction enzyme, S subunit [Malonomonas rubra DSM 5091]
MTAETFFANFGHLVDAPNGVQKLRELILQLAVQGKLVPQDPSDEPASVLLEKIKIAKERLVTEGRIKPPKTLPPISEDGIPFELPRAWEWCRFGALGLIGSSSRVHKKDWKSKGVPFLRAREIVKLSQFGTVNNELFISEELFQELSNGGLVPEENDLMITGVGTIGIPYIVKNSDRFYFKDASVLIFKNHYGLYSRFLSCLLRTPYWIDTIHKESMGTTVHTLTISRANEVPIPLPPLEEQKRIVAKVDQLMALCDELEDRQQMQQQGRVRLNNAALDALLTAREPDEFADHWQRISTNFDLLYDHPETIAKLRAAILQLAVQGKLVPQDPNDEPASVLLKRIKAEKERLVKEKAIKKDKTLPEVEGLLHPVPDGWVWSRFQDVTLLVTDGEHSTPPRVASGVPLATAKNIRDGYVDLRVTDFVSEETAEKCWRRCYPRHDDILMVCVGATTGRLTVIKDPEDFVLVRSVALIRPFTPGILPEYLSVLLRSPVGQNQIWGNVKQSAQPCLYIGKIKAIEVPVPSTSEQKRIVAKVDQLMSLCDELEVKLNQTEQHSEKLLEATVRQLLVA